MTSKEFIELEREACNITNKIADEFRKRIKELYGIAQEKGHYPEFGWLEGEMKEPDYDAFETEEDADEAYEKYEDFCSAYISFVWSNDHNFTIFDGYSFEIDKDGNVIFTSVVNREDECEGDFYKYQWYSFTPWVESNWQSCGYIVRQIEYELGLVKKDWW